jgi:hypothetical protein
MPLDSHIPLPTDNIYKFYALFGLLLFIFSGSGSIYTTNKTNELVFQTAIDIEAIKQIERPSPVDLTRIAVLQRRQEIVLADAKAAQRACYSFLALGVLLMVIGFSIWQAKIQPVQDEIAELQLEKLRLEVSQMKASAPSAAPPAEDDESGSPS